MSEKIETNAAPAPVLPKRSFRNRFRLVVCGIAIIALAVGVPYYLHVRVYESTDDAFIDSTVIMVSPRVSGHVAKVYPADNQWVKAGDLLVELDPNDFQARLDQALAALDASKAAFKSRKTDVELTRITATAGLSGAQAGAEAAKALAAAAKCKYDQAVAQLDLANAMLEQVKAEADGAQTKHALDLQDLHRYQAMLKSHTISRQDLDHATAAEQISAANLRAGQKRIDTQIFVCRQARAAKKAAAEDMRQATAQIDIYLAKEAAAQTVPDQLAQRRFMAEAAKADIDQAAAAVTQARLNLSYTRICAPTDGFVTKKAVEPGTFVQTGQSLLAIVPKPGWVVANFKETQLSRMRPGQPATIAVDAYPGITLKGHVASIQRGTGARFSLLPPENATGNYVKVVQRVPVKITLDLDEQMRSLMLAPGMSVVPEVNVSAPGRSPKPAATAPKGAPSQP